MMFIRLGNESVARIPSVKVANYKKESLSKRIDPPFYILIQHLYSGCTRRVFLRDLGIKHFLVGLHYSLLNWIGHTFK